MAKALCTIFTILLTLWNSEHKNWLLIKLFCFSSDFDTHVYYNFTNFHQNRMKNIKVLLIACLSVQNFKVSVELWKSYIVCLLRKKMLLLLLLREKSVFGHYFSTIVCIFIFDLKLLEKKLVFEFDKDLSWYIHKA